MDPMMLKTQKTWVCWDINSCPVPDGYDACMVRHGIESALRKAGNSGPVTITAIGNLKQTLKRNPNVLPAISSTGILLNHVPGDFSEKFEEFLRWTWKNPPPATLMLVTGDFKELDRRFRAFINLDRSGYTLIHAFPQSSYMVNYQVFKKCIWEKLLLEGETSIPPISIPKWKLGREQGLRLIIPQHDDTREETTRHISLEDKSCETGESSCRVYCTLCEFSGQSFEDFTTHLKGRDHIVREIYLVDGPPPKVRLDKFYLTFNVSKYVNKEKKVSIWDIEEDRMSL